MSTYFSLLLLFKISFGLKDGSYIKPLQISNKIINSDINQLDGIPNLFIHPLKLHYDKIKYDCNGPIGTVRGTEQSERVSKLANRDVLCLLIKESVL